MRPDYRELSDPTWSPVTLVVLLTLMGGTSDASATGIQCTPALPSYCVNIHIGCAGRTKVQTQAFTLTDDQVTFENLEVWQVEPRQDRDAMILFRTNHRDWIRIEADGRFSLRRYRPGAMMTRGTCNRTP